MFYEAIFKPSKKIKYSSDAKKLAGKKIAVQEGWIVEEGPFKGQDGFYIPDSTLGLIPLCDLKDLKPVSIAKWKEIHKGLGFGK
jgi:hypothetical protein